MTKSDYQDYQKSVAHWKRREQIQYLGLANSVSEPYFSWGKCQCCGDIEGGNREDVIGLHAETNEEYTYSICENCVYYLEYGQLPDQIMLEIERSV